MKERIIFHLPFKPDPNRASASQIRPMKMLRAFQDIGYEVDVVMGDSRDRAEQISAIESKMKKGMKYSFLYSESSTMPTLLTDRHHLPLNPFLDFGFFKKCKKRGIPIGLFYRDIHWRFSHYEKGMSFLKRRFATLFYMIDLYMYRRLIDVLFFPSLKMKEYVPELEGVLSEELPPGAMAQTIDSQIKLESASAVDFVKIIYVGGLGELYNLSLLCSTVIKVKNIRLTICCRREDYLKEKDGYKEYLKHANISVVHRQGEELNSLYETHDIACVYVKPTEYWHFAMPVKLFEYISFSKPILAVQGTATGSFVEANNLGWAIPYTEESILNWLKEVKMATVDLRRKGVKLAKAEHTWEARATQVKKSLIDL